MTYTSQIEFCGTVIDPICGTSVFLLLNEAISSP